MEKAYIVAACRTAVGKSKKGSAIAHVRPDDLLAAVLKEVVKRSGIPAERFQDCIIGCAFPEAEAGMNVGRIGLLIAGLPDTIAGETVNRFCSSGLDTMAILSSKIECDMLDVGIAGGVESMSVIPMGGNKTCPNPRLIRENPRAYTSMGQCADNVANDFGITREECDQWALRSNQLASKAIKEGKFKEEIVPIEVKGLDGKTFIFDTDEGPRPDTTLEGLAKLKLAFQGPAGKGVTTAGNASQTSCGAAATVIVSEDIVKEFNLKPLARLRGYAVGAGDPGYLGPAQIPAIQEACRQAGITLEDIGLIECNEAFASQTLYVIKTLGLNPDIVNVNGGAIALGHPLGCTGAKLACTLIYEMRRRGVKWGLETMCIGGGMGGAGVFELCE
ncbi:MAG TPA: thiolase family protein [Candidatus Hydrogenedens sp.]|nr:thiolase family protein [Candidatus Hydrogenedens sp.]HOL20042.1 thiolase family protein [Candidatus Hydrogenedens sp.]HPP59045.1 thiolase family protein [Candidatus Hydrogenedens sp.]